MAKSEAKPKKIVTHPANCDLCDGSGFVPDTWVRFGKYTEGVRRCPNYKIEVSQ